MRVAEERAIRKQQAVKFQEMTGQTARRLEGIREHDRGTDSDQLSGDSAGLDATAVIEVMRPWPCLMPKCVTAPRPDLVEVGKGAVCTSSRRGAGTWGTGTGQAWLGAPGGASLVSPSLSRSQYLLQRRKSSTSSISAWMH